MKEFIEKLIGRLEELQKISKEQETYGRYTAYSNVIRIVNQLAEEYINCSTDTSTNTSSGWIPCSERLPETNESVLCWAKSTARGGDVCFVGSCHKGFWFLQSSADTHSFPGQYVIVAWQPLPPAYVPEERSV